MIRRSRAKLGSLGFTLIELMIVVAIIGILAAIALPKFADLVRKSREGTTKGSLGALRGALSVYYADMEGLYPTCFGGACPALEMLTVGGKYLSAIPTGYAPDYHIANSYVYNDGSTCLAHVGFGMEAFDYTGVSWTGAWYYCALPTATGFPVSTQIWGELLVDCNHTDSKNSLWSNY